MSIQSDSMKAKTAAGQVATFGDRPLIGSKVGNPDFTSDGNIDASKASKRNTPDSPQFEIKSLSFKKAY